MANTVFSSEGALLFIMVATVALGFWLQRFKVFKTLGPALTVIVMLSLIHIYWQEPSDARIHVSQ